MARIFWIAVALSLFASSALAAPVTTAGRGTPAINQGRAPRNSGALGGGLLQRIRAIRSTHSIRSQRRQTAHRYRASHAFAVQARSTLERLPLETTNAVVAVTIQNEGIGPRSLPLVHGVLSPSAIRVNGLSPRDREQVIAAFTSGQQVASLQQAFGETQHGEVFTIRFRTSPSGDILPTSLRVLSSAYSSRILSARN